MNKMLVAVFDTETAAYEGLSALRDLHKEGTITLYSTAVIAKDSEGNMEVKQAADKGPLGIALGMATGGLIGLMLGPLGAAAGAAGAAAVSGAAVGASAGGLTGMFFDLAEAGIDIGFIAEVQEALAPGKAAVLAEVEESWVAPVDMRLGEHGGLVFRRLRSEVADEQLLREAEAFERELQELKAELAEASGSAKEAIEKQIAITDKKLQAIHEQAKDKLEKANAESKAKVEAIQQQMADANEKTRARMEKQVEELKADYETRKAKLKEAWEKTKEALS